MIRIKLRRHGLPLDELVLEGSAVPHVGQVICVGEQRNGRSTDQQYLVVGVYWETVDERLDAIVEADLGLAPTADHV